MSFNKGLCSMILLTAVAVQPALAAEAQAAKPKPVVENLQIADVPLRGVDAEDPSEDITHQATARDNTGFRIEELFEPKATCPPGGNATFTWKVTDACGDGIGLFVRFFDETNDLVFPNSTQAYSVGSGRTSTIKLSVKRGAKICLGAEPTDRNGTYWGAGLDNDHSCSDCCNTVPNSGNISRSVRLIC